MKATIELDDALYRRLKVEAARRGRTVRELVTDGVRRVLDSPQEALAQEAPAAAGAWRPDWLGSLRHYASTVGDHSMTAVRASIARRRAGERRR